MRTKLATVNASFAIAQKVIDIVLSFIYRTIFISIMGATYLGVNGLFTNIFTVMSLAELGVGTSIIYLLYEPLSKNDTKEISSLMHFFAKMYSFIGIFIMCFGIILIPFLPYLINNNGAEIVDLVPIYILMLMGTASGYFFAYKRSLLEADQKNYYNSINLSIFNIIGSVLKIIILFLMKNYLLVLFVGIMVSLCSNIAISHTANKIYPYLKEKKKISVSKKNKKLIFKRMKAVFIHNISNIILTGTDNILISKFINIVTVGIYSNYTMINNTIYGVFTMIFISLTSSVGNMKVVDSSEKSEKIFNKLLLGNIYLYFVSCVVLWTCVNDFIILWIGKEYVFSNFITALMIISLYISGLRHVPVTFINASGLNYNTRYKSLIEAILNLVLSLVLVNKIGLPGVVIGTIVSLVACSTIVEPYVLYKHWFKMSPVKYYIKYIFYVVLTVVIAIVSKSLTDFIVVNSVLNLFIKAILSFIFANLVFVILNIKNSDFHFYFEYFMFIIKKVFSKVFGGK